MFVRIKNINQKEKAIIGNIYRVPKSQNSTERLDTFINELPPFLERLNRPKQEVYLAGDYNINLLKINDENRYADFFDTMTTHSFFPQITLPTRLATNSSSLIDNIFSKVSPSMINSKSGIIVTALSDHFPVFITSDRISSRSKKPPSHVQMRVNNQETKQNMLTELMNMDIYNKLNIDLCADPNSNYNILEETIRKCKDKHMPVKTVKYNKHRHKKNSWITFGTIKSITSRDKLYTKLK